MKSYLQKRVEGISLTQEEAQAALGIIARGEANNSHIAAFLTTYMMNPITSEELAGFRDAMLDLALIIDLSDYDPMDVCGTGGDGKDTFNISTTASFVVAGAGQRIAKHGNHGVSSSVGSSTVLEYLGIKFRNEEDYLRQKIETSGICFLHAPLFHPAMRFVGPIRKELGIYDKTLLDKKEIIILTKTDVTDEKTISKKVTEFKKLEKPVFTLSLYDDKSIKKLMDDLVKLLRK